MTLGHARPTPMLISRAPLWRQRTGPRPKSAEIETCAYRKLDSSPNLNIAELGIAVRVRSSAEMDPAAFRPNFAERIFASHTRCTRAQESSVRGFRRRWRPLGHRLLPHRHREAQRRRALRLPQGRARADDQRSSHEPSRRSAPLGLGRFTRQQLTDVRSRDAYLETNAVSVLKCWHSPDPILAKGMARLTPHVSPCPDRAARSHGPIPCGCNSLRTGRASCAICRRTRR